MLDAKQLRMFKPIVDAGSIAAAAEQLELSQSAISQQLRALEEVLGVRSWCAWGRARARRRRASCCSSSRGTS